MYEHNCCPLPLPRSLSISALPRTAPSSSPPSFTSFRSARCCSTCPTQCKW
ncbi:hypothetical protein B296_00013330 [Ensete ventricosum]|uniref:Uncharacterized protein n=1 Tax=Ensete ventricosum TaxID=4639 RepID=A0A427ARK7_ENSVE|nr:hypothetical protein B296_00013330 [Ensete ventricosum]